MNEKLKKSLAVIIIFLTVTACFIAFGFFCIEPYLYGADIADYHIENYCKSAGVIDDCKAKQYSAKQKLVDLYHSNRKEIGPALEIYYQICTRESYDPEFFNMEKIYVCVKNRLKKRR